MNAQRKTVGKTLIDKTSNIKQRATLSIVPNSRKKRKRIPRIFKLAVFFLIYCVASLALTVDISQKQYDIVALKHELKKIEEENEILSSTVRHYETPQYLAAQAKKLGMIKPSTTGVIDLDAKSVKNIDKKTTSEQQEIKTSISIPKHPDKHVVDGVVSHYKPKNKEVVVAPITQENKIQKDTIKKSEQKTEEIKTITTHDFENINLNGGTIPAPHMKVPGE